MRTSAIDHRPANRHCGFPRRARYLFGFAACLVLTGSALGQQINKIDNRASVTSAWAQDRGYSDGLAEFYRPIRLKTSSASRVFYIRYYRPVYSAGWSAWAPATVDSSGSLSVWGNVNNSNTSVATIYWSGLSSSSGPVTAKILERSPFKLEWALSNGGPAVGSYEAGVGADLEVFVSWGSSATGFRHTYDDAVITIDPVTGAIVNVVDPTNPPAPNPLLAMAGKTVSFPYYVPDGKEKVTLEVGGQIYEVPVSGDIATLAFTIPEGWDGTVKLDGAVVALAPSLAYSGTPKMGFIGNVYNNDLPAGMTAVFDSSSQPPLPPGVTAGAKVSMPSGMTAGPGSSISGGSYISYQTTKDGVTQTHVVTTDTAALNPVKPNGGANTDGITGGVVGGSSGTGPYNEITEAEAAAMYNHANAAGAGQLSSAESAAKLESDSRVDTLFQRTSNVSAKIASIMSNFQLVTPGNVGKQTSWTVSLPGLKAPMQKTIDFSQTPWPQIRFAGVVSLALMFGAAALKRLKV